MICFQKCCRDNDIYDKLKGEEIKNMHFPKVKMVDKIQYGNYHGEISVISVLNFWFLYQTANK